jgi:hypothetical protein
MPNKRTRLAAAALAATTMATLSITAAGVASAAPLTKGHHR